MSGRGTLPDPVAGPRRVLAWLLGTVAVLVLLFGYRTSTAGPGGGAAVAQTSAAAPAPAGAASTVTTGTVVATRWGPVQVEITVTDGKITTVRTLQVPDGNRRDQEINARAVPLLTQRVLAAQSADVDTVSGATVTSVGYLSSLQAAIDAAHLGR